MKRRTRPPLDEASLQELALKYVERFQTSRAKLGAYLARKVRERGWDGPEEPDFDGLAHWMSRRGYIDDSAYAMSRSRSLTVRGYGRRRVDEKLRLAGVGEEDGRAARELAEERSVSAAMRFAERRKIGPFAAEVGDSKRREKAIAAMVRAGHSLALARAIVSLPPGAALDPDHTR